MTLAVVAVWGYTFVPMKVALAEIPPLTAAAMRFFFAAVPMFLFVRPPTMPWRVVVAYGAAIGIGQFGVLFLGMKLGMPAGLSSLVIQMQAFFTIALAVALLGERVRRHHIVGASIAVLGIVTLAAYKLASESNATLLGFMLVIVAALAWAVGNIIAKRGAAAHGGDMFALVVWSSLVPPVPLALLSYFLEGGTDAWHAVAHMSLEAWACVLFMSYGGTLFGYACWNALLHRYPTALILPFSLLIPISGFASGALFLGESLAAMQALGALLVFAGLVVNVFGPQLKRWYETRLVPRQ